MQVLLTEQGMVWALVAVHALVALLWLASVLMQSRGLGRVASTMMGVALAVNTVILWMRWNEAGRAPFKTLYETLLLYPWCVAIVTVILVRLYHATALLPFAAGICITGLLYAMYDPDAHIVNLPPALRSGWFVPHVVIYFVAYAALFASFAYAIMALIKPEWRSREGGHGYEDFSHRSAMFGFTSLTLGLVMGSVWGQEAWGDYWGWDPKENWALVTWLAYLAYLHLRMVKGWRGRPALVVCIVSFVAVVFTYLGMSLLPTAASSLHVYQ